MSLPEQIGVYGGGRMGAGIAHAFLAAGSRVIVVESDDNAAVAAGERVDRTLATAIDRGVLTEPAGNVRSRLSLATGPEALAGCGLVVEAVPESVALKTEVLTAVEEIASEAVLATNTSSLSVGTIGAELSHPERFLGLHFFNPVPASALVEIVTGPQTSAEVVTQAAGWVEDIGKSAITVTDSPGFASSRLGVALALEAMRMLEDGVASAEDIDTAMTLGYKHPTGPLRTTDIVGLDVRLAIAEHLAKEVGERFVPPEILRKKVAAGHLGRKVGRGFYEW